jgi:hypothetical protein
MSPTRPKKWTATTRILLELEQRAAVSSQGLSQSKRTNTTGKQRALDLRALLQTLSSYRQVKQAETVTEDATYQVSLFNYQKV